jgi:hypothetical protein
MSEQATLSGIDYVVFFVYIALSLLGSGTVCQKSVVLSLRERRFRLAERDDYTKLYHYSLLLGLATFFRGEYIERLELPTMSKRTPPKIRKLATAKQQRLDLLLEKNAEGTISRREKETLKSLVAEAEKIMMANAQRLAEFARSQSPQPPAAAVPVTVWVNPQLAER